MSTNANFAACAHRSFGHWTSQSQIFARKESDDWYLPILNVYDINQVLFVIFSISVYVFC